MSDHVILDRFAADVVSEVGIAYGLDIAVLVVEHESIL